MSVWSRLFGGERVRLVVRQSPDWRNTPHAELIEQSRAFCRAVGPTTGFAEDFIADIVRVWDRTFPTPFFRLRADLKDIAQDNLAHVDRATRSTLENSENAREALVIPIDDDDWLRPDLLDALRPHRDPAADGYVYGNVLCDSGVTLRALEGLCYTNCYAVTAKFLRGAPHRLAGVYQHWDANAVFHAPGFRRVDAGLYLSATNKHPASAMKLQDGLGKNAPTAQALRGFVETYVAETALAIVPAEAAWITPYRERVRTLLAALL